MNPDISNMSIEALKALAYDQLAIKENAQRNLNAINQMIAEKSQAKDVVEAVKPQESIPTE